uniref:Uncharacterized protein n=1 Tax=Anopheles atroparvus TaxID=41427 RepID=A0A182IMJ3_ANOAO
MVSPCCCSSLGEARKGSSSAAEEVDTRWLVASQSNPLDSCSISSCKEMGEPPSSPPGARASSVPQSTLVSVVKETAPPPICCWARNRSPVEPLLPLAFAPRAVSPPMNKLLLLLSSFHQSMGAEGEQLSTIVVVVFIHAVSPSSSTNGDEQCEATAGAAVAPTPADSSSAALPAGSEQASSCSNGVPACGSLSGGEKLASR